jgi:hypothetical protein
VQLIESSYRASCGKFWDKKLSVTSKTKSRYVGQVWTAALLLAALAETPAFAGPPFVTDDPEPVAYRTWEINYGATFGRSAAGTAGALPGFDINYGAYPGLQLHAQPQLAYAFHEGTHAYGLGDTELGVKYRLTAATDDERAWMVAVYPMLELPTGSARRNLGAGARSVYLPVWLQTTRGAWTVFGGGGYRKSAAPDAHNAWAGGLTLLYQASDRLQLGGEVFGSTRDADEARGSVGFNLGGVYRMAHGLGLLFSVGHGLRNAGATNRGAAYLGIRATY